MASFCGSCGSPVGGQAEFCGNCGARAGQVPPHQAAGVPAVAAPVSSSSGSVLKIVLLVVGGLSVLGILSVAGMYFTARHYVKIAENVTGVKAGDVVSSIREAAARPAEGEQKSKRDGCLLLSKEEASAILGVQVERVDGKPNEQESGEHCDFFVKPETNEQNLDKFKQAANAVKSEPSSSAKANQLPEGAVDMIKTMNRGVIEGARNGEAPYFGFTVERENGKIAFTAFQMADRLGSGGLGGGGAASESLGVGDKAAMGLADSRLCVVKGSSAFTLDLSQVTGARAKGIAIAKTILTRL